MERRINILVVGCSADEIDAVFAVVEKGAARCLTVATLKDALATLEKEQVDIVVQDHKENDTSTMALLAALKQHSPETEMILLAGLGTIDSTVDALRKGAFAYVPKPVEPAELSTVIEKALAGQALRRDNLALKKELDSRFGFEDMIGHSPAMQKVMAAVRQIADTDATILITGESGTGKELVARSAHRLSARANCPFVTLNCAALSEGIIESELFGHRKGAFTSALEDRKGRFEYANRGTLFLDEVGDIPLRTQVKLLRVIEEREVVPVGGNVPRKISVRLMAATNRDLEAMVKSGEFREDLYFRLKVVAIHLPALRERRGDIELLVNAFVEEYSKAHGRPRTRITPAALKLLCAYEWQGNVRELRNCIESMVVVSTDGVLDRDDIPGYILESRPRKADLNSLVGRPLSEIEHRVIEETLAMAGKNRRKAAAILGIGERTLYRKIKEYGL
jgi:two-component system response regulator HydG